MASLKEIKVKKLEFTIKGTSPLIQHKWSEKALKMIRDKGQKKATTKNRDARDPESECESATHYTDDGKNGIPLLAFKASLISAAHKDIGLEKTTVRKSIFFPCSDSNMVIPMTCSDPILREDHVRIGMGSADLRYRPEFKEWSVDISCEFDSAIISSQDILNLVSRAGFGGGIGEWRPEKGGEFGRFEVDKDKGYKEYIDE